MLTRKPMNRISIAMELPRMKLRMSSKVPARIGLGEKMFESPLDRLGRGVTCVSSMFRNRAVHS